MTQAAVQSERETTQSLPDRRIALVLMLCFAILWAILEGELGVRLRQPYDLRQVVWCRYASHLLVVALVWGWRTPAALWRTNRLPLQLGRSLLMLVMPMGFMFAAMSGTAVRSVWAVFWIAPLLILIGAWLYGGERAPRWLWVVTALATLAAMIVVGPSSVPTLSGFLFSLAMSASFALYVVFTRELRREALSANLFYTAVGVIIPLSIALPRYWRTPPLHDAIILFGIGALGFVALLALDRAAERTAVSWTAAVLTLQVVVVQCIDALRHTAVISTSGTVAALLIVACAGVVWFVAPRDEKRVLG